MTVEIISQTFYLGANASQQALRFALCLCAGLAAGVIALLYLRKARPTERALTDFFATVIIGVIFAVCLEFILDGKFELYGLLAYVAGAAAVPLSARKIMSVIREKRADKTCAEDKNADNDVPKNK